MTEKRSPFDFTLRTGPESAGAKMPPDAHGDDTTLLLWNASSKAEIGKYDEAFALVQRAKRAAPNHSAVSIHEAWLHYRRGAILPALHARDNAREADTANAAEDLIEGYRAYYTKQ